MPSGVAVDHPLLRVPLEQREYQVNIARSCLERATLVVLPTGLGKTVVALLVMAEILRRGGKRILVLAPTKPLVEQHAKFFSEALRVKVAGLTGEVEPGEREAAWIEQEVIVSTPQVVENDLRLGRISLRHVALLVFDEAHRAVGDYAYVAIGAAYREENPKGLALGMTASPGSNPDRILEVCTSLGISGVEIRTEYDPDVVRYVHDVVVQGIRVDMSQGSKRIALLLKSALDGSVVELRTKGFLTYKPMVNVRDLLAIQTQISQRIRSGEKNGNLYQAATLVAMALKVNHALVLVETQGLEALRNYLNKLTEEAQSKEAGRATRTVVKIPQVVEAMKQARVVAPEDAKVVKAIEVLREQLQVKPTSRIIVFTQYRDTAEAVVRHLAQVPELRPVRFVGQATRGKDIGLSQREQAEVIDGFREGRYNVLVSSSVGEEGLDIPQVDLVVFYEPVPSEIRTIQRRGRTGRNRPGRVVVLLSRDTRDEAYLSTAKRKERRMQTELERLRDQLKQRIFVADVGGQAFARATETPRGYQYLREALVEAAPEAPPQPKKKGQVSLEDYGQGQDGSA